MWNKSLSTIQRIFPFERIINHSDFLTAIEAESVGECAGTNDAINKTVYTLSLLPKTEHRQDKSADYE